MGIWAIDYIKPTMGQDTQNVCYKLQGVLQGGKKELTESQIQEQKEL